MQAASAAKTLVLLLDMSSSMNLKGRWELTIAAAKSVISNLAFSDMFGVVLFSTVATKFKSQPVPASAENKLQAEHWLEQYGPNG